MAFDNVSRVRVWVQAFPDRPNLMLQWHCPDTGKRKSRSAKTDDMKLARQLAEDLQYELNHGGYREPAKMPWDEFTDLYVEEKLGGSRKTTRAKARYVFAAFAEC